MSLWCACRQKKPLLSETPSDPLASTPLCPCGCFACVANVLYCWRSSTAQCSCVCVCAARVRFTDTTPHERNRNLHAVEDLYTLAHAHPSRSTLHSQLFLDRFLYSPDEFVDQSIICSLGMVPFPAHLSHNTPSLAGPPSKVPSATFRKFACA